MKYCIKVKTKRDETGVLVPVIHEKLIELVDKNKIEHEAYYYYNPDKTECIICFTKLEGNVETFKKDLRDLGVEEVSKIPSFFRKP